MTHYKATLSLIVALTISCTSVAHAAYDGKSSYQDDEFKDYAGYEKKKKKKLNFYDYIFGYDQQSFVKEKNYDTIWGALKGGIPFADIRYRYEYVDQDSKDEHAHASTLRTRLGYETGKYKGVSLLVESENISQIGGDNYDDTTNSKSDHPKVSDPEGTEINQAYIEINTLPETKFRIGRQNILIDNQRYIGWDNYRQNNQTFDAATLYNSTIKDTTLKYGYIRNVNRVFGNESNTSSSVGDYESDSHYVNLSNNSTPVGIVTAYSYLFDFNSDSPDNSSQTYGASIRGKVKLNDKFKLKYYGEFARQSDYGENTNSYNADYFHIAPALAYNTLKVTLGYEHLGSDSGDFAFRTPLATAHKFNGWTDKFITTSNNGLRDYYASIKYKVKGYEGPYSWLNGKLFKMQYHEFHSDNGDQEYGKEWGVVISQPILDELDLTIGYANYNAESFSKDTQKFLVSLGLQF